MCNSIRFAQISRNTITYHHGRILLITLRFELLESRIVAVLCNDPLTNASNTTQVPYPRQPQHILQLEHVRACVETQSWHCLRKMQCCVTLRCVDWCRRTEGETNAWVFGTRHIIVVCVVSARVHTTIKLCFIDLEPLLFYSSSSSIDLRRITRLSRPRSRPSAGNRTRELCISSQKL